MLGSIPGAELVEMDRYGKWSYCCGAGAKVAMNCYPEYARAVGQERLEEAAQVAEAVVTACPVCYDHLNRTAKKGGVNLRVYDLPLLMEEAMGINI